MFIINLPFKLKSTLWNIFRLSDCRYFYLNYINWNINKFYEFLKTSIAHKNPLFLFMFRYNIYSCEVHISQHLKSKSQNVHIPETLYFTPHEETNKALYLIRINASLSSLQSQIIDEFYKK
ncbi:unnamed protein product [Blepharisma stoltei]|uniref:Uncharacterized protein n=1 Tax=Blepharisma stoltei TaxID=1481888 RepID=A0AAU9IHT3_9CILI|nr:unnamed protein product [Blepharisma stoltei]